MMPDSVKIGQENADLESKDVTAGREREWRNEWRIYVYKSRDFERPAPSNPKAQTFQNIKWSTVLATVLRYICKGSEPRRMIH